MTESYPLHWPAGWPRTPAKEVVDGKYGFRRPRANSAASPFWTFNDARDALLEELHRLGATHGRRVLSSNFKLTAAGLPTDRGGRPEDQGIAVYFDLGGKAMVMACDRYTGAPENMRSIALAIEAMRQLARHGGGAMMERAFSGFQALPASGPDCWAVLGVPSNADVDTINKAYRAKAKAAHPEAGGSTAAMQELNVARDEALRRVRERA
jgi:hypothetical protein